ncbi:THAP domain-containing protein 1-like [Nymphalis io]|uniref:THAP domain-containing protein 1-like n=1 Tax=Inachis io TaxID=171585 RepID=UPI002168FD68|nr:THAP domain-containing protein 1-like [Nymphalis io]
MPKCALRNCKNITSRTLKKDGISYFRFPRDPIRCGEWTSIVSQQRREDYFKPNKSSVICSEHFLDKDMYVTPKGIKRLLKTAVPSVVDMTPQDLKIEIPDDGTNTEVCSKSSMFDLENKQEFKTSTTSLSIGSVLDTPQKVIIKSELHKCCKRLISKEKVIDNLRKKNSRLVKKTISLKNALKVLKKDLKKTKLIPR